MDQPRPVLGPFGGCPAAQAAVNALVEGGIASDPISVAARAPAGQRLLRHPIAGSDRPADRGPWR